MTPVQKLLAVLAKLFAAPPSTGPVPGTFALVWAWHMGQNKPPRRVMILKTRHRDGTWLEDHIELSDPNCNCPHCAAGKVAWN